MIQEQKKKKERTRANYSCSNNRKRKKNEVVQEGGSKLSCLSRHACRELENDTPSNIPTISVRTTRPRPPPTYIEEGQREEEVFSSEKSEMDFVTKKGIQT